MDCGKLVAFLLLCSAVLRGTTAAYNTCGAASSIIHLHFYMDDFYTGPNPTALRVVSGRSLSPDNGTAPSPRQFGDIVALNDPLTEGPDRGSARVGTAQGFAVRVSEGGVVSDLNLHLFLEAGEYSGSSVVVNGRVDLDLATRESVVVGGTGQFRFARGYMLSRDYEYDLANGGVVELDVYVQVQD
ncbi:dirigent protein 1-like [Hordeum vulgare]|uniref:Dirigent protein n=1 Tax=Hordeum vulgare subsp. vulgare TaxID=112509 RepID=A0A8I6XG91_HORVV|nr:dirigent protein 1-like [Hordeum vulgare subsp. vulgare]KAE8783861.1 dirigent protein 1-like [Hordeum vulgare]KAI4997691.1 hypothetical protein ZWY2020_053033 [Hordeum vulgare]